MVMRPTAVSTCAPANELKGLPETVTIRDVVSTYIYSNTLVVLELSGRALRQYIERSAAYFGHDAQGNVCISDEFLRPKVQHYNYDYFSGIDYVIDTRRPVGQRVVSMRLVSSASPYVYCKGPHWIQPRRSHSSNWVCS